MARKLSKGKKPKETMRQRQMRLRREELAKKKLVKSSRYTPTSQRVDKVKVKVEPQKKLTGTKTTKYLPASKKGGPLASTKGPRRRNVNTNPSSNATRTATGSKPTPRTKPSLGTRAYVKARQLGINPTKATDAISKGARLGRLGTVATAAALLEAGLAATPGPTGRRVRAAQADRSRREDSVREMAGRKGRQVLEVLGLVDRKSEPKATPKTKPTKTKPRGMSNIPPAEAKPGSPSYVKPKTDKTSSTKASTPTANKPAAPTPTKKAKSSADNMRTWSLANKQMIEKVGTKAQKAILAKALKPKKPVKKKSSALAIGGYA